MMDTGESYPEMEATPQRKRFSIWRDVLVDQELTEGLKSSVSLVQGECIQRSKKKVNPGLLSDVLIERDVESFVIPSACIKKKLRDEREDRKRKESGKEDVKTKPGSKKSTRKSKKPRKSQLTNQKSNKDNKLSQSKKKKLKKSFLNNALAIEISSALKEPRVDLILSAISVLGEPMVKRIFAQTLDVETAGGIMLSNMSRRRTPGGVFFHLIKSDKNISKSQSNKIFGEDIKLRCNKTKKANKKQKARLESLADVMSSCSMKPDEKKEAVVEVQSKSMPLPEKCLNAWKTAFSSSSSLPSVSALVKKQETTPRITCTEEKGHELRKTIDEVLAELEGEDME